MMKLQLDHKNSAYFIAVFVGGRDYIITILYWDNGLPSRYNYSGKS